MQGLNSFSEIVYASRVNALIKQSGDLIEAHHLNHVNHLSSKRRHISTLGIQRRYFKDGSKKSAINGIIKCQPENTTDKAAFWLNTKSEDQLQTKKMDWLQPIHSKIREQQNFKYPLANGTL